MTLRPFVFLDDQSTADSDVLNCMGADQLTLSVESSGTVDLTVYGKCDYQSTTWHELGAISLADYSAVDGIDATGVYAIILSGITQIKITNNGTAGSCNVFGNLCNAD